MAVAEAEDVADDVAEAVAVTAVADAVAEAVHVLVYEADMDVLGVAVLVNDSLTVAESELAAVLLAVEVAEAVAVAVKLAVVEVDGDGEALPLTLATVEADGLYEAAIEREAADDGVGDRVEVVVLPGVTHRTSAMYVSATTSGGALVQCVAPAFALGTACGSEHRKHSPPAMALKVCALHGVHAAALAADEEPGPQSVHVTEPASAENEPAPHAVHAPPKGANWPGAHCVQRPAAHEEPAGQAVAVGDGVAVVEGAEEADAARETVLEPERELEAVVEAATEALVVLEDVAEGVAVAEAAVEAVAAALTAARSTHVPRALLHTALSRHSGTTAAAAIAAEREVEEEEGEETATAGTGAGAHNGTPLASVQPGCNTKPGRHSTAPSSRLAAVVLRSNARVALNQRRL